jgi:hypothetical protein
MATASRRRRSIDIAVALGVLANGVLTPAVSASTATVTTLDVPAGTQYAGFVVTAHLRPAPQAVNGLIPAVGFLVNGTLNGVAPLDANGDGSTELTLPPGAYSIVASFDGFDVWDASASAPASVRVGVATSVQVLNVASAVEMSSQSGRTGA